MSGDFTNRQLATAVRICIYVRAVLMTVTRWENNWRVRKNRRRVSSYTVNFKRPVQKYTTLRNVP